LMSTSTPTTFVTMISSITNLSHFTCNPV
jgi:hypothetical protein